MLKQSQKTYVPGEMDLKKKWYLVDLKGKTLGPAAVKIADLIRGKGKVHFTPQHDCGDFVVAVNARDVRLSKNKLTTKTYHWHSGFGSGFKTRTAKELLQTKPEKVLYEAVWGMLPRNKLRNKMIKKLSIFAGSEHDHAAQSPTPFTL